MQATKNSVVTLSYEVHDAQGNLIEKGREPMVYLHGGYAGIFQKVEEAVEGKKAGDSLQVRLEPEDAFGEYDAERVQVEARNMFPENIEVGMQFERGGGEAGDELIYTITDITDDKVVVDGNHPLAGMALNFSCSLVEVRAATAEEMAHGHVHGAHGHHH